MSHKFISGEVVLGKQERDYLQEENGDNKLETPDCEHCARISLAVILQLTIAIIVIILPLKRFLCSVRTK